MSDDLIKRSEAIKAVSKVDDYGDGIGFEVRSHCLVELELVPSADRPQGEWIRDDIGTLICSECKRPRRDSRIGHTNFCNSCGAQMKGADND